MVNEFDMPALDVDATYKTQIKKKKKKIQVSNPKMIRPSSPREKINLLRLLSIPSRSRDSFVGLLSEIARRSINRHSSIPLNNDSIKTKSRPSFWLTRCENRLERGGISTTDPEPIN